MLRSNCHSIIFSPNSRSIYFSFLKRMAFFLQRLKSCINNFLMDASRTCLFFFLSITAFPGHPRGSCWAEKNVHRIFSLAQNSPACDLFSSSCWLGWLQQCSWKSTTEFSRVTCGRKGWWQHRLCYHCDRLHSLYGLLLSNKKDPTYWYSIDKSQKY